MRTKLVCALVSLFALLSAAAVVGGVEVPMARVAQLMSAVAETPGAAREHIGTTLGSLMDEILTYLGGHGLPEEALTALEEGFAKALDAFLAGASSPGEFGAEIAALARELGETAEGEGITSLPVALLERIGLNPGAIEALQGEKDLTGLEIAALAQTVIGSFAPAALPAGPPQWVPAWGAQDNTGGTDGPPEGIPTGPPANLPGQGDDAGNVAGPPAGVPTGPPANLPGGNDEDDDKRRGR